MAKTTKPLNLGTKRASDDDLSPMELPTTVLPGAKPNYTITERGTLSHSWRESELNGCGLDTVDRSTYPDPDVLDADIAHSKAPLNSQHRPAVRENWGGGAGEQTNMKRWKRGGLQTLRDIPANRPENR